MVLFEPRSPDTAIRAAGPAARGCRGPRERVQRVVAREKTDSCEPRLMTVSATLSLRKRGANQPQQNDRVRKREIKGSHDCTFALVATPLPMLTLASGVTISGNMAPSAARCGVGCAAHAPALGVQCAHTRGVVVPRLTAARELQARVTVPIARLRKWVQRVLCGVKLVHVVEKEPHDSHATSVRLPELVGWQGSMADGALA
eukprot:scaffold129847_cov66-Phaeocystis_antarctica.AAC.8